MTFPYFLLALGIGAALLSFWFVVRFPERGPKNMREALIHVGIAFAIGWFVPNLFTLFASHGYEAALTGVFLLVFPAIFYTFLSGAWWLKLATDAMNQHRQH